MNYMANIELMQRELNRINKDRKVLELILNDVEIVFNYFQNEFDPALKILNYSDDFDFEAKSLFYYLLNGKSIDYIVDDEEILKEISELDMKFIFAYVEEISYLERFIMNPDQFKNKIKFNKE